MIYKRAGTIALDPGLILVFVIAFSVSSNIIFFEFIAEDFVSNAWVLWETRESLQNIVLFNTIFTSVFTFFYLGVCRLQSYENDKIPNEIYRSLYNPIYWIAVYLITFVLSQILIALNQTYILTYWNNVVDLAFLIAISSILLRIKGIRTTFFLFSIFILFTMFIYYPIIIGSAEGEGYVVNKGGVVKMLVFCLVFLSLTKYQQLLITPKMVLLGLCFLPFFLGFANFIEELSYGTPSFMSLFVYSLSGFEFQIMENQAIIYDDIQKRDIDLRYGTTYIRAIYDIFIPTSEWIPPSDWFAEQMNMIRLRGEEGSGYAFSFIAEGLLNFGTIGVAIAGLIAAILLSSLRLLYSIRVFLKPAIIASLITLPYYVYRADFSDVIKRVEFTAISFVILITIYLIVKYILRQGTVTKNFSR